MYYVSSVKYMSRVTSSEKPCKMKKICTVNEMMAHWKLDHWGLSTKSLENNVNI